MGTVTELSPLIPSQPTTLPRVTLSLPSIATPNDLLISRTICPWRWPIKTKEEFGWKLLFFSCTVSLVAFIALQQVMHFSPISYVALPIIFGGVGAIFYRNTKKAFERYTNSSANQQTIPLRTEYRKALHNGIRKRIIHLLSEFEKSALSIPKVFSLFSRFIIHEVVTIFSKIEQVWFFRKMLCQRIDFSQQHGGIGACTQENAIRLYKKIATYFSLSLEEGGLTRAELETLPEGNWNETIARIETLLLSREKNRKLFSTVAYFRMLTDALTLHTPIQNYFNGIVTFELTEHLCDIKSIQKTVFCPLLLFINREDLPADLQLDSVNDPKLQNPDYFKKYLSHLRSYLGSDLIPINTPTDMMKLYLIIGAIPEGKGCRKFILSHEIGHVAGPVNRRRFIPGAQSPTTKEIEKEADQFATQIMGSHYGIIAVNAVEAAGIPLAQQAFDSYEGRIAEIVSHEERYTTGTSLPIRGRLRRGPSQTTLHDPLSFHADYDHETGQELVRPRTKKIRERGDSFF